MLILTVHCLLLFLNIPMLEWQIKNPLIYKSLLCWVSSSFSNACFGFCPLRSFRKPTMWSSVWSVPCAMWRSTSPAEALRWCIDTTRWVVTAGYCCFLSVQMGEPSARLTLLQKSFSSITCFVIWDTYETFLFCFVPKQEQINSLVKQVCGRAMLKNGAGGGVVMVSGGGGDPCNGLSPVKASPAKRGPRKRATVEVSLARLSSSHMPKATAVSWGVLESPRRALWPHPTPQLSCLPHQAGSLSVHPPPNI